MTELDLLKMSSKHKGIYVELKEEYDKFSDYEKQSETGIRCGNNIEIVRNVIKTTFAAADIINSLKYEHDE